MTTTKRVVELRAEFARRRVTKQSAARISFTGVGDLDVYNITAPFSSDGRTVIAGRVEPRGSEHSQIMFFEGRAGAWTPIDGAPVLALQDPFQCRVQGQLIVGGVQVQESPKGLGWRTVFYRGSSIFDLRPLLSGPLGMKDIRFCDLSSGGVAVFTRPQGIKGGRGTIGYMEVPGLEALSVEVLEAAPLIEGMVHPLDWVGANEAHLLPGGDIGVLSHCACFENDAIDQPRHYYAAAFRFRPSTREFSQYRIIAVRGQFGPGGAKRADLIDVIFPGGLLRGTGGAPARLYAGVSDAEAHWLDLPDPFL